MNTAVLLVATATRWFGTARIPRPLAHAGFDVALLAPKDSLAQHSRFIGKIGYLPEQATAQQWAHAFAATVKATSPQIVLPCDDMAFQLLTSLALAPPANMRAELQLPLSSLIRDSLGDPAWYRASVDKILLPPAAAALGVRVPPHIVASEIAEARAFVATHGYPVVVKRRLGFAGSGVAICANDDELAHAFRSLPLQSPLDLGDTADRRLLVQAHVPGRGMYYQIAAWKGRLLAGMAVDKVLADPEPMGPATVCRYHRNDEVRDFARRLVEGFGMTGLMGLELIVDERTREPHLLEVNRRITPGTHRGAAYGLDLCGALHAAMHDQPYTSRTDLDAGEEDLVAHFPQEWLRDMGSSHLRTLRVDVPWDEPELIEAMLKLRSE